MKKLSSHTNFSLEQVLLFLLRLILLLLILLLISPSQFSQFYPYPTLAFTHLVVWRVVVEVVYIVGSQKLATNSRRFHSFNCHFLGHLTSSFLPTVWFTHSQVGNFISCLPWYNYRRLEAVTTTDTQRHFGLKALKAKTEETTGNKKKNKKK